MIDIANVILREVTEAVQAEYSNCDVLSYNPDVISKFPCVTVVEKDNSTYRRSQDNTSSENHAELVYEIQAYSNNSSGKKEEAKKILALADEAMLSNNFTRTLKSELPNADRSVYRLYASYTAIASKGTDINGNTVHQIYRR